MANDIEITTCETPSYSEVSHTTTLWVSAVMYENRYWVAGPSGYSHPQVCESIRVWKGVVAARVYPLVLPLNRIPAS